MVHWYTADPHFGHANIIRYCGRPFRSAPEMDAALLAAYAAAVGPDDDLWVIGDLCLGDYLRDDAALGRLFAALPGRRHLVTGNHDSAAVTGLPWDSVRDIAEIDDGGVRAVLCHYPLMTWPGAREGAVHLFGHVHHNWAGTRLSINVGVDQWAFAPVRMEDILVRARTLPVSLYWEQLEPGARTALPRACAPT